MDLALENARVIITAGASGIGRAILDAFLAEGARIATCDIDTEALEQLPGGVIAERVDVSDAASLTAFVEGAIARLGGLDCLVNNAGIAGPTARIEDVDLADWEQTMAVCLTSQFLTSRAAVAALRKSSNPSIVNLSSVAGRVGFKSRTPYAAAKWGVIGLTKSLALELGENGIRVNAILPGLVAGDRQRRVMEARAQSLGRSFSDVEAEAFSHTAIKEYVTPQQIADQILFLASRRGRTITGQAVSICGGTEKLG